MSTLPQDISLLEALDIVAVSSLSASIAEPKKDTQLDDDSSGDDEEEEVGKGDGFGKLYAMKDSSHHQITSLRQASPYLAELRGKVLLVVVEGAVVERHSGAWIEDLLLLNRIGVQMILVPDVGANDEEKNLS